MINTTARVYDFVNRLSHSCLQLGHDDIAMRLDDAIHLGSSGLEILGAIRNVLTEERARLKDVVSEEELLEVVEFVSRSFGR